jgi:hypothetical protein
MGWEEGEMSREDCERRNGRGNAAPGEARAVGGASLLMVVVEGKERSRQSVARVWALSSYDKNQLIHGQGDTRAEDFRLSPLLYG